MKNYLETLKNIDNSLPPIESFGPLLKDGKPYYGFMATFKYGQVVDGVMAEPPEHSSEELLEAPPLAQPLTDFESFFEVAKIQMRRICEKVRVYDENREAQVMNFDESFYRTFHNVSAGVSKAMLDGKFEKYQEKDSNSGIIILMLTIQADDPTVTADELFDKETMVMHSGVISTVTAGAAVMLKVNDEFKHWPDVEGYRQVPPNILADII